MEKERLNFNTFLDGLDSRDELDGFNASMYVNKYVIEGVDAKNLTYEYVSFYTIDYLEQILRNDHWANKKDDYKTYLLNRIDTTSSDLNKAQYLTILAKCFRSNVEEAWESLKVVFLEYILKDRFQRTTKRLFDNLSYVGLSNKKYKEGLYEFISNILVRTDISDANLISILGWLTSTNKFKYQLTKIDRMFEVSLSLLSKTSEPQRRKHIIKLALKVWEKQTDEEKRKSTAKRKELYELLADNEYSFILPDDPNNAAVPHLNHMFLRHILQWYTLAGNSSKVSKAEKELMAIKDKLVIPSFPVTIYTPDQVKVLNDKLEFAHSCPAGIFLWALSEDFFNTIPTNTQLNKGAEDFVGLDNFSFTYLDYNYNSKNISDSEEPNYKKFLLYDLYAKPALRNFILVFLKRIKEGTLCFQDIYDFLTVSTNFGKTYRSYRNEPISNYDLVENGLKHIFYQFKKIVSGYQPDFTLSLDSLCPKIERILREMLHSVKASILKIDAKTPTPKKETMLLLDDLLDAAEIRNFMSDEDLNFFRYVLTNDGQNIRNYSAHGLYSPIFYKSDAGIISGFLVFVAILRLAVITNCFKYEVNNSGED
ncbi:MAG: DUF4209 domain-containing protein [Bacteroidales bacterium]|nr:DUF4209 domain-containing protein [Bacteroidales bacterium]